MIGSVCQLHVIYLAWLIERTWVLGKISLCESWLNQDWYRSSARWLTRVFGSSTKVQTGAWVFMAWRLHTPCLQVRLPVTHFDVLRGCNAKPGHMFKQGFRVVCPLEFMPCAVGFCAQARSLEFLGGLFGVIWALENPSRYAWDTFLGFSRWLLKFFVWWGEPRQTLLMSFVLCSLPNPSSVSWEFVSPRTDMMHANYTQNIRFFPLVFHISLVGSAKPSSLITWLSWLAGNSCYTSCVAFHAHLSCIYVIYCLTVYSILFYLLLGFLHFLGF